MERKTLLLVDDEMSILRSYARDLQAENYAVSTASDGEQAIEALQTNTFNIVITDLVMPGVDGIHVLREAKSLYPEICVIVLTGYGDLSSAVEALRFGADDYLLKPLDTDELLVRLTQLFKKQERRQKLRPHRNIVSVCSYCRSVRNDNEAAGALEWMHWENYLTRHTGIRLSHGCCPDCFKRLKIEWNLP